MFAGCPRQIYLQLGVGIQFTIPFCLLHHSRMYTCRLPLSLHSARLHFLSSWVCWPPVVTVIEGSQICVITRTGPVLRCATLYWENLQELVGFFLLPHPRTWWTVLWGTSGVFLFANISVIQWIQQLAVLFHFREGHMTKRTSLVENVFFVTWHSHIPVSPWYRSQLKKQRIFFTAHQTR